MCGDLRPLRHRTSATWALLGNGGDFCDVFSRGRRTVSNFRKWFATREHGQATLPHGLLGNAGGGGLLLYPSMLRSVC